MPQKTVQIEGLEEVVDSFRGAGGILEREGRSFLREMGIFGVDTAQRYTLNAGAVDTNELIQGIHYKIDNVSDGMQVTVRPSDAGDKYAIYVEEGTRPHWTPRSALQGWADRHGIPVFLVQRKIAEEGTEPRYIFRDTFEDFKDEATHETERFIELVMRKL